ncbi:MAG: NAD(P)/FAD-dependent oxidoreductase [Euryarchaeota archaeon]|nr:NAD(P)/FAD-dependent oxidoreductase [Euryarchaeota archaeon]
MTRRVDVLVVGAGPAGSTAARYAAQGGAKTLIIEKKRDVGVPVVCGEYLPHLQELQAMLPQEPRLEELFTIPDATIARRLPRIDLVSPMGERYRLDFQGLSVERILFDRHLAIQALDAGAELMVDTEFKDIRGHTVTTTRGDIEARAIIACDGPISHVALRAGMERPTDLYPCVAYEVAGDYGDTVELWFGSVAPGGYAWVIPKRESCNIGLGVAPGTAPEGLRQLLSDFIAKTARQNLGVFFTSGVVPMGGPVPRTVQGPVMLAGDAAGHVMATNGGGIPTAMMCGRIAGQVAAQHTRDGTPLTEYERRWRESLGPLLQYCIQTKKLADFAFKSDIALELAMRVMGISEIIAHKIRRDGLMGRAIKGAPLTGIQGFV